MKKKLTLIFWCFGVACGQMCLCVLCLSTRSTRSGWMGSVDSHSQTRNQSGKRMIVCLSHLSISTNPFRSRRCASLRRVLSIRSVGGVAEDIKTVKENPMQVFICTTTDGGLLPLDFKAAFKVSFGFYTFEDLWRLNVMTKGRFFWLHAMCSRPIILTRSTINVCERVVRLSGAFDTLVSERVSWDCFLCLES